MTNILKTAFVHALATALYVGLVASFMFYVPRSLIQTEDIVLIPIFMLLLLVFSAAVTGLLVFARPVMWYLNGNKKEALSLVINTLAILFAVLVLVFVLLATLS